MLSSICLFPVKERVKTLGGNLYFGMTESSNNFHNAAI